MQNKVEIYARRAIQNNQNMSNLEINSNINKAAEASFRSCKAELQAFKKGPTFSCAKATNQSQNAICNSTTLSYADASFHNAVKAAWTMLPAKSTYIREYLKQWIASRDDCRSDVNCIMSVYNQGFK